MEVNSLAIYLISRADAVKLYVLFCAVLALVQHMKYGRYQRKWRKLNWGVYNLLIERKLRMTFIIFLTCVGIYAVLLSSEDFKNMCLATIIQESKHSVAPEAKAVPAVCRMIAQ